MQICRNRAQLVRLRPKMDKVWQTIDSRSPDAYMHVNEHLTEARGSNFGTIGCLSSVTLEVYPTELVLIEQPQLGEDGKLEDCLWEIQGG